MEIMLDEIGIAGGYQRKNHGARVGHVGCGVEPVFEEEKRAEDESGGLALREEVGGKQERNQPLQQRASPKAESGAKPSEEIVAAFMDDQICAVD